MVSPATWRSVVIAGSNEILCESQSLKLQSGLAGNVDILNGTVVISPDGTLAVDGTVEAEEVVAGAYSVKEESETVGSATLYAGTTEILISNTRVEGDSKVFVTATNSTGGQQLFVSEKVAGSYFTVSVDSAIGTDIEFDWWLLSIE